MTDKDKTLIAAVLDRSGSMQSIKHDTEGGFDAFIAEQRKQPGKAVVSLFQFDDHFDTVYTMQSIQDVPALALKPRGMTALLDAVGNAITLTGEELASLKEDDRPGKVIFVIMTDGQENSSREWTYESVKKIVKQQTDDYQWEFIFLGANMDAVTVGGSMGFAASNSMSYAGTATMDSYAVASSAVSSVRSGGKVEFSKEDRQKAMGEK